MQAKNKSRLATVNLLYLLVSSCLTMYLAFAKTSQMFYGRYRGIETAIFLILTVNGIAINVVKYRRNNESKGLRYTVFITYIFTCCFLMYTGRDILTYAYLFQGLIGSILFFDLKYVAFVGIASNIANVLDVILIAEHLEDRSHMLVQVFSILVFSVTLYFITMISNYFNDEAMQSLDRQHKRQEAMLKRGLDLGTLTGGKVRTVHALIKDINSSSITVTKALEEITNSTQSTAEHLQDQTVMSQNIQEIIEELKTHVNRINQVSTHTVQEVTVGTKDTNELKEKAGTVARANEEVNLAMQQLLKKSEQVQEITQLIITITNNTNLLALNASIEAARAGAQGAGFAVVAEEIRKLAEQTKHSTESINQLLRELSDASMHAKVAVETITTETIEQNQMIEQVGTRFQSVSGNMHELKDSIGLLNHQVVDLVGANQTIVGAINTLSATSEEISAETIQAFGLCESNEERIDQVTKLVTEIATDVKGFEELEEKITI